MLKLHRKTQDVLDCLYRLKQEEQEDQQDQISIFWIHAGSPTRLEQDYRRLADLVKLPGHDDIEKNIGHLVKDWLQGPQSGKWILILDSADNKLDFFPEEKNMQEKALARFIPQGNKGTVIVTTCDNKRSWGC